MRIGSSNTERLDYKIYFGDVKNQKGTGID
jgi:hypothetical protein